MSAFVYIRVHPPVSAHFSAFPWRQMWLCVMCVWLLKWTFGNCNGSTNQNLWQRKAFSVSIKTSVCIDKGFILPSSGSYFANTMFPSENHTFDMWPALFEQALTSVLSKSSGGKWAFEIEAWIILEAVLTCKSKNVSLCMDQYPQFLVWPLSHLPARQFVLFYCCLWRRDCSQTRWIITNV